MKGSSGKKRVLKMATKNKSRVISGGAQKRIEEKAYEFFARRGYVHGGDVLDWTLAQEITFLKNNIS